MYVSLNLVKKYIDLPEELTTKQIAFDLTMRTVEVESVVNTKDKFHDIVVGKIIEVKPHPDADKLRVCMVDIGENMPVQIVCGGSNLYENELVVVSKPGAEVVWHGEGEPVIIEKTKMRGVESYGMICGAEEVYLDGFFPPKSEKEIVDLGNIECSVGQNIADLLGIDDTIIEIDNKSLTNRPDLWGHYGIARELATIYNLDLKPIENAKIEMTLPKYNVEIHDTAKCRRYVAVEIENIEQKESPLWMRIFLSNCGMRPINAIVDITNFVMITTGQPLHAFDRTHVDGSKIVVRNAKEGEKLVLLDNNVIELNEDDLVICDESDPMALAGIKGGIKDSILPETTGIVLEVANFAAGTVRKSSKKFDEKTDAGIRFEKGLDTQRVDLGLGLALKLIKEIFPESRIVAFCDEYPCKTENETIDVPNEFLKLRLGKELSENEITRILTKLGYEVKYENEIYHVIVPTYRSTGDVSLKDDVLGDLARIIGYNNFEQIPLTVNLENSIIQKNVQLERRVKEYLSNRCGFNEIYTYSWTDEKYINSAKLDKSMMVKLATPPSPEMAYLRSSLIPNMLEAVVRNLRYFDEFRMYELAQCYEKGEYHESSEDETLPIHKKMLCGSITGKNAREVFFELKGVLENMARYCHMENLSFEKGEKKAWADINACMDIKFNGETVGNLGLVSIQTMTESKIKHTNVAMFEVNYDKFVPLESRTNNFEHLSVLPLADKDLSIVVDENVSWKQIYEIICPIVKEVEFVEEYHGEQIPEGKKSIMLNIRIENQDVTKTSEEINKIIDDIMNELGNKLNAYLRQE